MFLYKINNMYLKEIIYYLHVLAWKPIVKGTDWYIIVQSNLVVMF